jgi:DNA-directed RNA polymerase specialized sigma24 family protein
LAYEGRKRRGGVGVSPETRMASRELNWDDPAIEEVVGDEPTPEFAAQVAEEYDRLLHKLGDDAQRQIAVWKMEGLTNNEIAGQLKCSSRTVERKLEIIRMTWSDESAP